MYILYRYLYTYEFQLLLLIFVFEIYFLRSSKTFLFEWISIRKKLKNHAKILYIYKTTSAEFTTTHANNNNLCIVYGKSGEISLFLFIFGILACFNFYYEYFSSDEHMDVFENKIKIRKKQPFIIILL